LGNGIAVQWGPYDCPWNLTAPVEVLKFCDQPLWRLLNSELDTAVSFYARDDCLALDKNISVHRLGLATGK
jgi:hypothetical protein